VVGVQPRCPSLLERNASGPAFRNDGFSTRDVLFRAEPQEFAAFDKLEIFVETNIVVEAVFETGFRQKHVFDNALTAPVRTRVLGSKTTAVISTRPRCECQFFVLQQARGGTVREDVLKIHGQHSRLRIILLT